MERLLRMVEKYKLIPNIRVGYKLNDIIRSFFIRSKGSNYQDALVKHIANIYRTDKILLTSSGRAALYYILSYLQQRKVVVPAYTCDVVVEAAVTAEKEIIYAHVDETSLNVEDCFNIDNDSIFIATHQYGFPCKIKEIYTACKQKGAVVIEDCAGAFGTEIDGQMVGTFGDFAIFSFNASKLINAPSNGGFLIAKKDSDIKALKEGIEFKPCSLRYKMKSLCRSMAFCFDKNAYIHYWLSKVTRHDAAKAHLSSERYIPNKNVVEKYKYGFYNWQAYVVLKQLKRLPHILRKREELSMAYRGRLNERYQKENFDRQKACIRYPIYLDNREDIRFRLRTKGVEIGFGFEHFVCPDSYVEEIEMAKQIAYLPYGSNFSEIEVNHIINCLNQDAHEQNTHS